MKKLPLNRFRKRASKEVPSRITNETVAEHRERILAGGRRFKYPIQYARHKLVINALIISIVALVLLVLLGWWQLYIAQNSSSFMYRLTRLTNVPVASVDSEMVPFGDYLMLYRASEHWLGKYDEIKLDSKDGQVQLAHVKRQSLDNAEKHALATKLARERGLSVSEKEITAMIDQQRTMVNGRMTMESYEQTSRRLFDWSPEDNRLAVKASILRAKVSFAIDEKADSMQKRAGDIIRKHGGDLEKAAEEIGEVADGQRAVVQTTGLIHNTSTLSGVGVPVAEAAKLPVGEVSGVMKSNTDEGYFFVKVLEKTDSQVNLAFIHIPLTEFDRRFEELRTSGKVKEFISVPESTKGGSS